MKSCPFLGTRKCPRKFILFGSIHFQRQVQSHTSCQLCLHHHTHWMLKHTYFQMIHFSVVFLVFFFSVFAFHFGQIFRRCKLWLLPLQTGHAFQESINRVQLRLELWVVDYDNNPLPQTHRRSSLRLIPLHYSGERRKCIALCLDA